MPLYDVRTERFGTVTVQFDSIAEARRDAKRRFGVGPQAVTPQIAYLLCERCDCKPCCCPPPNREETTMKTISQDDLDTLRAYAREVLEHVDELEEARERGAAADPTDLLREIETCGLAIGGRAENLRGAL